MIYPTDSQVTLVNTCGSAPTGEYTTLIFDKDDTMNTTLRVRGNYLPSYFVNTQHNTTIVYAGDKLLATVTRRLFLRNQITFPGARPTNLGRWLKAPILSTLPLVFHAHSRRFEWRKNPSGQLVLYESNHLGDIVAWYSGSHNGHDDHVIHAACLVIKPEMDEVRDMIVLSCLLAEHKLRVVDMVAAEQSRNLLYSVVI